MNDRTAERVGTARLFIHEALLAIGLFLATLAVNVVRDMSSDVKILTVSLAKVAELVQYHENRLTKLEHHE